MIPHSRNLPSEDGGRAARAALLAWLKSRKPVTAHYQLAQRHLIAWLDLRDTTTDPIPAPVGWAERICELANLMPSQAGPIRLIVEGKRRLPTRGALVAIFS